MIVCIHVFFSRTTKHCETLTHFFYEVFKKLGLHMKNCELFFLRWFLIIWRKNDSIVIYSVILFGTIGKCHFQQSSTLKIQNFAPQAQPWWAWGKHKTFVIKANKSCQLLFICYFRHWWIINQTAFFMKQWSLCFFLTTSNKEYQRVSRSSWYRCNNSFHRKN